MRLPGKNALVTGASRGIGRGIALALAKEGANVAINYFQSKDKAEAVVSEIRSMHCDAIAIRADVSHREEVEKMVAHVLSKFHTIDILVNNAGIGAHGPIEEVSEEQWDRVINVNLKGVFNCCKAVVKHMTSRKQGKIVNISSIAGLRGTGFVPYVASKSGIIGITMSLARELIDFGITVNAVAPGLIDTDMVGLSQEKRRNIKREIPIGWLGKPEHIGQCVVFLLKDDYMTGQIINVSGGRMISV